MIESFSLAALTREHLRARHDLARSDCFGDAILLERIPIFECARRSIVSDFGYAVVPEHAFAGSYDLTPFLELGTILETKTIPYRRSADAMRRILERAPRLCLDHFALRTVFARNCPHHETAHALFYEIVSAREGTPRGARLVEVLVASEAVAVAVESFAALLLEEESAAVVAPFLAMNADADSFLFAAAEQRSPGMLASAARLAKAAAPSLFRFLAAAFLLANLRPAAIAAKPALARRLAEYAEIPAGLEEDAERLLAGLGLVVDVTFRTQVVPAFFRYLDLEAEYLALCRRPLADALVEGSAFHDHLLAFVRQVLPPRQQPSRRNGRVRPSNAEAAR